MAKIPEARTPNQNQQHNNSTASSNSVGQWRCHRQWTKTPESRQVTEEGQWRCHQQWTKTPEARTPNQNQQ